ncbi:Metallo-dependent phosphatase-like protein [Phlebopus sp. FC_14]|nr:Metallo-dependent phosphatase-like protein [Phlebopus sp. FC_14]
MKHISLLLAASSIALAFPTQVVLDTPNRPRLHGRFLHITDMHPDPYYKAGASPSAACHRKMPGKANNAGYYGTPFDECDSPLSLTNFTLDYLQENWSDDIDFVIWTGDSARHDNDDDIPRPLDEIYNLNRAVAKRMEQVFSSKGIPVIPTLGNNDVWRPNDITRTFASIWSNFIPPASEASYIKGGYYSVEVIPNALAVISMNTMYYYDSNKAVKGCPTDDLSDPGNIQFDWLEQQLNTFRSRQMQARMPVMINHYFHECYYRYTELSLRFQDTILGHLFGFYFLDADDLFVGLTHEGLVSGSLFDTLITDFGALPEEDINYDHYAVVNVNPSVVPNPYLPSFRVFAYNVSGIEDTDVGDVGAHAYHRAVQTVRQKRWPHGHGDSGACVGMCECAQQSWRCKVKQPWHSDDEAPSRRNSLWTPLGYAQYYMRKLGKYNEKKRPAFELEYLTFSLTRLHGHESAGGTLIPLKHLPKELHDRSVKKSKFAPYGLEDLTIRSWVGLGCRLGQEEEKKLRKRFRKYMYMGGEES